MILTTSEPCQVHKVHTPIVTYCELHHIIPQAWQVIFQPVGFDLDHGPADPKQFPNAGLSPDRKGVWLWDARTVPVCRTGHGNVHVHLVNLMRSMSARTIALPSLLSEAKKMMYGSQNRLDALAAAVAYEGAWRFAATGSSFVALWSKGEWGEI